jgi:MerR family transcriptional regulator, light-induced transcriptional regulator
VWSGQLSDNAALGAMLRQQHVDVVGFSLAGDDFLMPARAAIAEARRASCNPGLAVLVGGPSFLSNHDRVQAVGADGTAEDAPQAVALAERLVARQAGRDAVNHLLNVIDNGSG